MSVGGPTPESLGYELLAPDPGLVNPDLALDAALAPVEPFDTAEDVPRPFGRSWQFDFLSGQFVREGSVPKVVYETDTLITWVEKALRTAQMTHPIYEPQFGVAQPFELIGTTPDEAALSGYQEAVEQALLQHDRIVEVENFSFSQDPFDETLRVSFTVQVDAPSGLPTAPLEFQNVVVGQ